MGFITAAPRNAGGYFLKKKPLANPVPNFGLDNWGFKASGLL